ncbi:hypothetical protein KQH62_00805 [bacterium]|nr:hypothetical protein [bacterium]
MSTTNINMQAMRGHRGLIQTLLNRSSAKEIRKHPQILTAKPRTVGTLLEAIQPVPDRSILLGRCTDGLPFLMELGDPTLGAILIGCEAGHGKTHQLQVIVESAMRTQSPRHLQVAVLTLNPSEWASSREGTAAKFLRGLSAWHDPRAEELLAELTALAEARRDGERTGADVLLILDDLNAAEDLGWEAQVNLRWLLEYGAQSGIWPVATLNADLVSDQRYWVDTFRTRILGKIHNAKNAATLANREGINTADLLPGTFKIWTGSAWLKYTLPLLEGVNAREVLHGNRHVVV